MPQGFVGVQKQQVVTLRLGQGQRLAAVMAKISPRAVVQRARYPRQRSGYARRRVVHRAGVHNHPMVNVGLDRGQAALDHMRLVAHNHVQANTGFHDSLILVASCKLCGKREG